MAPSTQGDTLSDLEDPPSREWVSFGPQATRHTIHNTIGTKIFGRLKRLLLAFATIVTLTCSTYVGGYMAALMNYKDTLYYGHWAEQPTFWDYQLEPGMWVVAFLMGILIIMATGMVCYALSWLVYWIWHG